MSVLEADHTLERKIQTCFLECHEDLDQAGNPDSASLTLAVPNCRGDGK